MSLPTDLAITFTPVPAGTFPGSYANLACGGYYAVANDFERDQIVDERRIEGMECFVISSGTLYRLNAGPWGHTTADWTPLNAASAGYTTLIWNPGAVNSGNVFGDFTSVYDAVNNLGGLAELWILGTPENPCVIDFGSQWDLKHKLAIRGCMTDNGASRSTLFIGLYSSLLNPRSISGPIAISNYDYSESGGPGDNWGWIELRDAYLTIDNYADIRTDGGANTPIIRIENGYSRNYVTLTQGATINTNSSGQAGILMRDYSQLRLTFLQQYEQPSGLLIDRQIPAHQPLYVYYDSSVFPQPVFTAPYFDPGGTLVYQALYAPAPAAQVLPILVWDDGGATSGNRYGNWNDLLNAIQSLGGACIVDVIDKFTTLTIPSCYLQCNGLTVFRTASKDRSKPLPISINDNTALIDIAAFDGAFTISATTTSNGPVLYCNQDIAFLNGAFLLLQGTSVSPLVEVGANVLLQFDMDSGGFSQEYGSGVAVFRLADTGSGKAVFTRQLSYQPDNSLFMGGNSGATLTVYYDSSVILSTWTLYNGSVTQDSIFRSEAGGDLFNSFPNPKVSKVSGFANEIEIGDSQNPLSIHENFVASGAFAQDMYDVRSQFFTPDATQVELNPSLYGNVISGSSIYDYKAIVLAVSGGDSGLDVMRLEIQRSAHQIGGAPFTWLGAAVITNLQATAGAASWLVDIDVSLSNSSAGAFLFTGEVGRDVGWLVQADVKRISG